MFHSVSLFSQAPLARGSRALPSVLCYSSIQDNTGLSSRVVIDLLDGFEHKILLVYMDIIYYCSPDLFFTLAGEGIGAREQTNAIEKISPSI